MCICETSFEVTVLGLFCLASNTMTCFFIFSIMGTHQDVGEIVGLVVYGGSAVISVILLMGVMSSSKKLLNVFVLGAMLRVLCFCLLIGFYTFQIYSDDKKSAPNGTSIIAIFALRFLQGALGEWSAKDKGETSHPQLEPGVRIAENVFSILADSFVIYRIRLFSDKMPDNVGKPPEN